MNTVTFSEKHSLSAQASKTRKRGRQPVPHEFRDGVEQKFCGGCRAWLSLSSFGSAVSSWDGLTSRCRQCVRAYDNAYEARRKAAGIKAKTRVPAGRTWMRGASLANGRRVWCRLYNSFDAMHKRCYSPSRWEYDVYGARGIRVCDEWRHNYPAFRAWALANGFKKGLTLDRIDGTKGYSPDNCRWATREEQTYNTKSVHKLTLNGVTKLLPIWAKELGFTPFLLRTRRSAGWTDEQILTTPRLTNGQVRPGVQHKPRGRRPRDSQTSNVSPPNQE